VQVLINLVQNALDVAPAGSSVDLEARTDGARGAQDEIDDELAQQLQNGADVDLVSEPEYFRVVAALEGATRVTTTLPPPDDAFTLSGRGKYVEIAATTSFVVTRTGV